MVNVNILELCYDNLGRLFNSLNDKTKYACPYLIIPDDNYKESRYKILLCGKETNGWGEKEGYRNTLISNPKDWGIIKNKLLELYNYKVNIEWGKNLDGSFWPFYQLIRENIEIPLYKPNIKPKFPFCGLVAGNVSLLGYTYDTKGFNSQLVDSNNGITGLSDDFNDLVNGLKPDLIIATIGYKKSSSYAYINILEKALKISYNDFIFYEIIEGEDNKCYISELPTGIIPQKDMRYEFCFGILSSNNIKIIIAPHPERKKKIKLKAFIDYILTQLPNVP